MKTKNLIGLFLLLLGMNCFTSCENTSDDLMIWDFTPIVLRVSVDDIQGNDLLNPDVEGSIANQGIKAIYKETVYEKDSAVIATKAYMAFFEGLQTYENKDGKYYLTFGEFNGETTFDKEQLIIDWNDGTQDTITFSSKLRWKAKNDPVFDREFLLNGKDVGSKYGAFTIIK